MGRGVTFAGGGLPSDHHLPAPAGDPVRRGALAIARGPDDRGRQAPEQHLTDPLLDRPAYVRLVPVAHRTLVFVVRAALTPIGTPPVLKLARHPLITWLRRLLRVRPAASDGHRAGRIDGDFLAGRDKPASIDDERDRLPGRDDQVLVAVEGQPFLGVQEQRFQAQRSEEEFPSFKGSTRTLL